MKKLVKIASWLFATGSTLLIVGVFYIYTVMVPALPSIDHLEDTQYQVPLRIYDRNEVLLAEFGEHRRIPVRFDKIPRYLIDAVVSVEDDQFWNHVGGRFLRAGGGCIRSCDHRAQNSRRQYHHHAGRAEFFPEPGTDLYPQVQ